MTRFTRQQDDHAVGQRLRAWSAAILLGAFASLARVAQSQLPPASSDVQLRHYTVDEIVASLRGGGSPSRLANLVLDGCVVGDSLTAADADHLTAFGATSALLNAIRPRSCRRLEYSNGPVVHTAGSATMPAGSIVGSRGNAATGDLASATASAPSTSADAPMASLLAGPATPPVPSPDSFRVVFETNKGNFTVSVTRSLAPNGADRFYELVNVGYFSDVRFFRVLPGFVAQFGLHGNPNVNKAWENAALKDEPRQISNTRGSVAFATSGANTRSNQFFVNTVDNSVPLDAMGLAPFGHVVEGMDVIGTLYSAYGEEPSQAQPRIAAQGNQFLAKWFPALDYIKSAKVLGNPTRLIRSP